MVALWLFACLGFLLVLLWGGSMLKGIVSSFHKDWATSGPWVRFFMSTVSLLVLFIILQMLDQFHDRIDYLLKR